nr:MAG TPA: hypothetical protein [Caudoviricetes sp.]
MLCSWHKTTALTGAFPRLAFVWFTAQGLRVVSPPPSQQP